MIDRNALYHLWYGNSKEGEETMNLLNSVHFPYVPVPVSGMSRPELVVGLDSYVGIEKIKEFLDEEFV